MHFWVSAFHGNTGYHTISMKIGEKSSKKEYGVTLLSACLRQWPPIWNWMFILSNCKTAHIHKRENKKNHRGGIGLQNFMYSKRRGSKYPIQGSTPWKLKLQNRRMMWIHSNWPMNLWMLLWCHTCKVDVNKPTSVALVIWTWGFYSACTIDIIHNWPLYGCVCVCAWKQWYYFSNDSSAHQLYLCWEGHLNSCVDVLPRVIVKVIKKSCFPSLRHFVIILIIHQECHQEKCCCVKIVLSI